MFLALLMNCCLLSFQVESAAEEPRVLCIIQDTTNSKTVNERVTLNLPASTPLKRLFEDVASKVGYVNGTFDLVWGNGDNVTDTVWQKYFLFPLDSKRLNLHIIEKCYLYSVVFV